MTLFENAVRLAKAGDLEQAWDLLYKAETPKQRNILMLAYDIALLSKRDEYLERSLSDLRQSYPTDFKWCYLLAQFYERHGNIIAALAEYQHLLNSEQVDRAQLCNKIANLYSQELMDYELALTHYEKALAYDPEYDEAYFNLGNLFERAGEFERARQQCETLMQKPAWQIACLTKLLELPLTSLTTERSNWAQSLSSLLSKQNHVETDDWAVDAEFALARYYEQQTNYQQAWHYYQGANERDTPSSQQADNAACVRLQHNWQASHYGKPSVYEGRADDFGPLFICGLFRTGSTLLERLLTNLSNVETAGESEFFFRRLIVPKWQDHRWQLSDDSARTLGQDYIAHMRSFARDNTKWIIDKRPDNFLVLDFILSIFPDAKVLWTCRQVDDTVFSMFSQRLGPVQAYARNITSCRSYCENHQRLVEALAAKYPTQIRIVHYENLVSEPKNTLAELIKFIGIEDATINLSLPAEKQLINTPSLAQVRQALHTNAIGRAKPFYNL